MATYITIDMHYTRTHSKTCALCDVGFAFIQWIRKANFILYWCNNETHRCKVLQEIQTENQVCMQHNIIITTNLTCNANNNYEYLHNDSIYIGFSISYTRSDRSLSVFLPGARHVTSSWNGAHRSSLPNGFLSSTLSSSCKSVPLLLLIINAAWWHFNNVEW